MDDAPIIDFNGQDAASAQNPGPKRHYATLGRPKPAKMRTLPSICSALRSRRNIKWPPNV